MNARIHRSSVAGLAGLTCALLWSGCVSYRVSIQNAHTGAEQREFSAGERAAIDVQGGAGMLAGVVVRVVKLPERKTVYREVFAKGFDEPDVVDSRSDFDLEPRSTSVVVWGHPTRDFLPPLGSGQYVAEKWADGKLKDQQSLTVTRPPGQLSGSRFGSGMVRAGPVIVIKTGGGRRPTRAAYAAEKLDDVVTLTPTQKDAAIRIFGANEAPAGKGLADAESDDLQRRQREQIRALLTPAQQRIYDTTPEAWGGGLPRLSLAESKAMLPEHLALREAIRGQIVAYLESSAAVAARFGNITRVQPSGGRSSHQDLAQGESAWEGTFQFDVQGALRGGTLLVEWEKIGLESLQIVQVSEPDGHVIALN